MAAPDLTGRQVNQTYKNLLQIDNSNSGIDATLRPIRDGEGTASVLQLSTTAVTINGLTYPTADGTINQVIKTDGSGNLSFATVSSGSTGLDDLTDVTITAVASGELIKYDGAGWINNTLAEAGISAVGHTHVAANITDLATAAVAFSNKTGNISQWTNDSAYITVAGVPVPATITLANEATDTTCFPVFVTAATGDLGLKTNAGLAFNSNTGNLTVTSVTSNLTGNVTGNVSGSSGSCTGNAATATALQTPRTIGGTSFDGTANIVPATITVADTTDATCSVALFESATGDLGPKTDGGITYNATTGALTSTSFVGPLTGNVTGNVSGSSGSTTGNAATVTTNANLTGEVTSSGNAAVVDKTAITNQAADATPDGATDYVLTYDASANALKKVLLEDLPVTAGSVEGTAVLSTGEVGGTKFLREDGDGTSSWQTVSGATLADADYGDVTVSSSGTVLTVDSVTVADAAGDATTWPMLSRDVTGSNKVVSTDAGLTYDASTNNLATTTFTGALSGNASTANALQTARAIGGVNFDGTAAITPANITIANEATDTTCFPLFTTAATGDLPPKSNANLTFNSNTASLGCTTFVGALTGNVTGNVTGSSGSCTGNSATVTTNANLTGEVTSTGNAAVLDKTAITNRSADATPDPAADYVLTYDASGAVLKKALLQYVGGMVKIESQTASASATIDFTTLSTAYRDFVVKLSHVVPATDNTNIWVRTSTDGGSTYDAGASDYRYARHIIRDDASSSVAGDTADNQLVLFAGLGTGTREELSGTVTFHDPQAAKGGHVSWELLGLAATAEAVRSNGGGVRTASANVDAIRFMMSSGNIASGTFTLYGIVA